MVTGIRLEKAVWTKATARNAIVMNATRVTRLKCPSHLGGRTVSAHAVDGGSATLGPPAGTRQVSRLSTACIKAQHGVASRLPGAMPGGALLTAVLFTTTKATLGWYLSRAQLRDLPTAPQSGVSR
jgi:hypothetical protein